MVCPNAMVVKDCNPAGGGPSSCGKRIASLLRARDDFGFDGDVDQGLKPMISCNASPSRG